MSGINLKSKAFLDSLRLFEEDRKIDPEFIIDVLKEAITKTYQKHIDAPEAKVRIEVTPKEMKIYHILEVVDDDSDTFDETRFIKTGVRVSDPKKQLNHTEDFNCLLIDNEKIGGDIGRQKVFYLMIWVYDNGKAQDYLQGLELAYRGEVTFVTAEGNEISASFD